MKYNIGDKVIAKPCGNSVFTILSIDTYGFYEVKKDVFLHEGLLTPFYDNMRPELKVIKRDKNGFATEKCKAEMYESLPIMVFANEKYWNNHFEYVEKSNWQDFIADIELDTKYIYYFKCPKIEQIED